MGCTRLVRLDSESFALLEGRASDIFIKAGHHPKDGSRPERKAVLRQALRYYCDLTQGGLF